MNLLRCQSLTTRLFVALLLASSSVIGWYGVADAATCFTCHAPAGSTTDIRPVEGAYRNISTGSIKGSHAKHMPAPTPPTLAGLSLCTDCHGLAVNTYTTRHRNGFINVTTATTTSLKYSKGSSFPQSGNPTLGTCSAALCHDDGKGVLVTTPAWGTTSPPCSVCHAAVPTTDSHTKHLGGTLFKAAACADCHNGTVQGISANPVEHRDGNIDVYKSTTGDLGYPSNKSKGSPLGTCATSYCHSSGQSADGLSSTPVYASTPPTWGGTVVCGSCHATTGMSTGTHSQHIAQLIDCGSCHTGATATAYNSTTHVDGNINVTSGFSYAKQGTPGNGYSSCSTTVCHGPGATPVWGSAPVVGDTCTKCHGTPTVGVTAANRNVIAPSDATATDTGKVSSNLKIGAHQTHLQYFNGLSEQGATIDDRCAFCHGALPTSGSHATGSSIPVFQGLATRNGAMLPTPSYSAGSCTNTYCHNPAGTGGTIDAANAGTGTTPSWTNSGYIANAPLKTQANCGKCHKSPGDVGFNAPGYDHGTTTIASDCSGCHGHNGGTGGIAGQQHMDGIKHGSGSCNNCHGYPPMPPAEFSARATGEYLDAKVENYNGGGGHHTSHLPATVSIAEGFIPCLPCHPSGTHNQGGGTVLKANVNVNDNPADMTFRFDDSRTKRYIAATMSCSNISCHFQPTPAW